jgi:hypothetical protein
LQGVIEFVRLSHVLALRAVEESRSDHKVQDLVRASFGSEMNAEKVCEILHEAHLLSLKANFELFLNRLLSTVWTFHFSELAPDIPDDEKVALSELAAALVQFPESSADVRDFLIDTVVPRHGLGELVTELEKAIAPEKPKRTRLTDVLNQKAFHLWPQINAAFEVRHLVEHRDGKVDERFRAKVRGLWANSSWGTRQNLEDLEKVVIEEEDIDKTYTAMLNATDLLTEAVLRWSSLKAPEQATAS